MELIVSSWYDEQSNVGMSLLFINWMECQDKNRGVLAEFEFYVLGVSSGFIFYCMTTKSVVMKGVCMCLSVSLYFHNLGVSLSGV